MFFKLSWLYRSCFENGNSLLFQTPFSFGMNHKSPPYPAGDYCLLCRSERKDSSFLESGIKTASKLALSMAPKGNSVLHLPLWVCPDCRRTVEKEERPGLDQPQPQPVRAQGWLSSLCVPVFMGSGDLFCVARQCSSQPAAGASWGFQCLGSEVRLSDGSQKSPEQSRLAVCLVLSRPCAVGRSVLPSMPLSGLCSWYGKATAITAISRSMP